MKPGTYGARLRDYYRRREAEEQQRAELAAKIDAMRLRVDEATVRITEGRIDLPTRYKRHAIPGTYPMRYWDIEFTEESSE